MERDENRLYQPTFEGEEDIWQWDWVFGPMTKSFPFEVTNLSPVPEAAQLRVWLHGASDFPQNPDHHVRLYVNGTLVTETWWDGETPHQVDAEIGPGLLQEGENILDMEDVGDTDAAYSMAMLNRFEVSHPAELVAEQGALQGSFTEPGAAVISGVEVGGYVLDVTGVHPQWLTGVTELESGGVSFWAESDRSYLMVSKGSVKSPEVRRPQSSGGQVLIFLSNLRTVPRARLSC